MTTTIQDGIDNGTLMPCSKEAFDIYHGIAARMSQKNPAPFMARDGVSDAGLIDASRDMFEALEEVYASASSGGISSVAWLKLCDARRKAHGAV